MTETTQIGEAYGFFDCATPKASLQVALPGIVQRSGARGLEVYLMEVKDLAKNGADSKLLETIFANRIAPSVPSGYVGDKEPRNIINLKYIIKGVAKLENEKVADELGMVLNEIYLVHSFKEPFYWVTAWKENDGEYWLSACE